MSGIPGFFNRDGRPADPLVMGRQIRSAQHRGPDGARCWTSGSVAIGHQALRTLPEDVPQPIVDVSREIVVSLDGRIDNRSDLIAQLATGAAAFRTPSDAEVLLAAYNRWGEDCPSHILGDFAFAIWDGPRRRMFCARDVMGIKPFYYVLDSRQFVWGSELRQVLASGAVASIEPNEGMVAEYLAKAIQSQDETIYRGVMRLPAAHSMSVSVDDVRISRYWRIDPHAELSCRSDGEYAEQFHALFKDAVACRLRIAGETAGAYLSGGLDSSSVVAMSQHIGRPVETFSLVFPGNTEADESTFISDVVRRWNLKSHVLPAKAIEGDVCRTHVTRRGDTLDLPADIVSECLLARMRERGTRVALTGIGGDYCFSGSLYHYADLLKQGDVPGFLRQVWADRSVSDAGWSVWQPFVSGVRPLIPARWRRRARPLAKRLGWLPAPPDWIEPAFASRVGLADRLRPPAWPEEAPTFARRSVCESFALGWPYLLLENSERSAAEYGVEERHPFFDRRLIEFGVAVPESQRWRGNETKYVLRRAMEDLLPRSVLQRNGKGDFRVCVAQGVDAIGNAGFFSDLRTASRGWIRAEGVSALYRRTRKMYDAGDEDYCDGMFKLWMTAGIELWYRSAFLEGTRHGAVEESRSAGFEWSTLGGARPENTPAVPSAGTH